MLPALAHVLPCHVKACFELVVEEIAEVIDMETFDDSISEKVDGLSLYFKNAYIEGPTVTKKTPLQIEIWNQFEADGEGVARTTNSVEGWHYGLQAYFTGSQPNVRLLLRNLKNDSKMQKFNTFKRRLELFVPSAPVRKKNQKTDASHTKWLQF